MQGTGLLAPAGTLRNLRYARAYGADAVYAGMPRQLAALERSGDNNPRPRVYPA
jgi:collagenase-like PrtC family protease